MAASKDDLPGAISEIEWHWLRQHLERDAVIVVDERLDLAEAAARLAADDTTAVRGFIADGLLLKPTLGQLAIWNAEPARRFRMLIAQPYVLIQEIPTKGA